MLPVKKTGGIFYYRRIWINESFRIVENENNFNDILDFRFYI